MSLQPPLEDLADYRLRGRTRMVMELAKLRQEWQKAANGKSLLNTKTPVGLLLNDIANCLELTPQERDVFLGGRLINEVEGFLEERITRKLTN